MKQSKLTLKSNRCLTTTLAALVFSALAAMGTPARAEAPVSGKDLFVLKSDCAREPDDRHELRCLHEGLDQLILLSGFGGDRVWSCRAYCSRSIDSKVIAIRVSGQSDEDAYLALGKECGQWGTLYTETDRKVIREPNGTRYKKYPGVCRELKQ